MKENQFKALGIVVLLFAILLVIMSVANYLQIQKVADKCNPELYNKAFDMQQENLDKCNKLAQDQDAVLNACFNIAIGQNETLNMCVDKLVACDSYARKCTNVLEDCVEIVGG